MKGATKVLVNISYGSSTRNDGHGGLLIKTGYTYKEKIMLQAVAGKNSVNAYITKQIVLIIFYKTSCTAKPLPKGLYLGNLFVHFWNHYKAMILSKNQYHINCQHTSKTSQNKTLGHSLSRKAWVQLNRLQTGIKEFGK